MKLLSLELENFRQHRETKVDFALGLTGIVGPNGSGKSSMVEAISFALFGTKAIRGKMEFLKSRNARDGELEVNLSFEHEGNAFRLMRSEDEAFLYQGGEAEPLVQGKSEVTARISALLGMNLEEFTAAYFTEQKGLEFLSGKKGPADRERFIVRMLGYDRLEKVQELLRTDHRDRKNELAGMDAGMGSRGDLERLLAKEQEEFTSIKKIFDEGATSHEKNVTESEELKKLFERREGERASWAKLKQTLQEQGIRAEERTKRVKNLERERTEILDTRVGAQTLREFLDGESLGKLLADARERVEATRSSLQDAETRLREEEAVWRERILKARGEFEAVNQRLKGANDRRKRFESLDAGSDCPTCAQELGESFERVKRDFLGELSELEASHSDIARVVKEVEREPEGVTALRGNVTTHTLALKACEAELRVVEGFERHRHTLERLDRELQLLREEISLLDGEQQALRKKIADLRFSEDEYLGLKGRYEAQTRLTEISRLQRMKLEGDLNIKKALLERTQKEIEQYDARVERSKHLREEGVLFQESDEVLTSFRRAVNAAIRPRLAELASDYIAELTDGRYVTVEIGADFSPSVVEDGEAKAVISGGEADLLNLCVRLALSHMLAERAGQSFSLLILDEVFGSLDENRRNNVLLLLDRLGSRFEQIIIITHMDDIKEGVEHLLYVEYDDTKGEVRVSNDSALDDSLVM